MVADGYGILRIIASEHLVCLLEIQEWLIYVNLAIICLLTNFYIKNESQNYCNFYVLSQHIQIF